MNHRTDKLPLDEAIVVALAAALRSPELDPVHHKALRARMLQRVRQPVDLATDTIVSTGHRDH